MSGCTSNCNQGRNCTCVQQNPFAAPEGGNVWFAEPEPELYPAWQRAAIWGAVVVVSVLSLLCISVGAGAIYQHFFN